eukprot:14051731-Alexandrium_andersonii.AAC.1
MGHGQEAQAAPVGQGQQERCSNLGNLILVQALSVGGGAQLGLAPLDGQAEVGQAIGVAEDLNRAARGLVDAAFELLDLPWD